MGVGYTQEETQKLKEGYDGTRESVNVLAEDLNKSQRSVIAKLSKEGLYKPQSRLTKAGDEIISKADLVAMLEVQLGIELPTLVKAGKEDLRKLVKSV